MKAKKPLLILAALLLLAGGALIYLQLFGGPYRFVEVPLRQPSLAHLQSSIAVSTPADAAYAYLTGLFPGPQKRNRLEVAVHHTSGQVAVVTVINRDCQDDCLWVTYDRITLRPQGGAWLPVQHQAAWQGRGRIGWTTKPTI